MALTDLLKSREFQVKVAQAEVSEYLRLLFKRLPGQWEYVEFPGFDFSQSGSRRLFRCLRCKTEWHPDGPITTVMVAEHLGCECTRKAEQEKEWRAFFGPVADLWPEVLE